MLKRFEIALAAVVGMALTLVACQPPDEQPQSTEGEAQVVVRGLSAYNITRMVVTAQPANVSQTLVYNSDAGTFSGRMLLPAGEQTLTAEGYAYVSGPDGGYADGGYADGGYADGGYADGGYADGGYADGGYADGGYEDPEPPMDGGGYTDAGPPPPPMDGGMSGSDTLVASGSATVSIVAGSATAVTLRIYDLTPQPPQGDIGPLIRSLKASKTETTVGTSVLLEVDAVDLDGDALSYWWSSSCMSSSFGDPFAASTAWSSSTASVCRLSVTVSSRAQSVTESVEVTVFSAPVDGGPGEGSVQVTGEYIARPYISNIYFAGTSVYRSYSSASLPSVKSGMTYYLDAYMDFGTRHGTFVPSLESDCGGTITRSYDSCSSGGYCSASYTWTTPAAGSVCKLTVRAANGTLTDSFSVGVAVR